MRAVCESRKRHYLNLAPLASPESGLINVVVPSPADASTSQDLETD